MNEETTYEVVRAGRRRSMDVRQVQYQVTQWGDSEAPLLFYLHGWADTGSTFQFVVDALRDDWFVVAPDWRGFGRSAVSCTSYWFPDYLADLHALLDAYSPEEPARVVGHSMGANIAGLYAGTMPERVRCFVNVEGFGLPDSEPADAPKRYRQWLEQERSQPGFMVFPDFAALAARIRRRSPLMSAAQADFVAREWGCLREDGQVALRADPRHKLPNPVLYRRAEAEACWQAMTADVLYVSGGASGFSRDGEDGNSVEIDAAGHMLHFDAPAELAATIEAFLRKHL